MLINIITFLKQFFDATKSIKNKDIYFSNILPFLVFFIKHFKAESQVYNTIGNQVIKTVIYIIWIKLDKYY